MGHSIALQSVLFLGAVLVVTSSAHGQPGQNRGLGAAGGRGPHTQQARGGPNRADPSENADKSLQATPPVIANYGSVVRLPNAAQQPRSGTKILVDLTSGGDVDKLNVGLEKVAKYLNIYAGGGVRSVKVQIAVVLHGDATLIVLNPEAYAAKFKTDGNPNMQLLHDLHGAGVELYVCGQSLISKGSAPDDVAEFVETAVSALTAVVNLQSEGYAYVPIAQAAPASTPEPDAVTTKNAHNSNAEEHIQGAMAGGMGRGPGATQGMGAMRGDMTTLHAMFADRDKIRRTVTNLPDGAETVTESDDAAIAKLLKEHVPAMEDRVLANKPLPPMSFHPIFLELLKHADDYSFSYEETDKGMKVKYQSDDPYVVMLVQEHAKLVSRFIENGMREVHTPYTLPKAPQGTAKDGR